MVWPPVLRKVCRVCPFDTDTSESLPIIGSQTQESCTSAFDTWTAVQTAKGFSFLNVLEKNDMVMTSFAVFQEVGIVQNWREHEKQKALRMLGCFQWSRYALYVSVAKLLWILCWHVDVVLHGAAKFHVMPVALATHEKGTSMPHKAWWHQPFCFRMHVHPKGCQIIEIYQNMRSWT